MRSILLTALLALAPLLTSACADELRYGADDAADVTDGDIAGTALAPSHASAALTPRTHHAAGPQTEAFAAPTVAHFAPGAGPDRTEASPAQARQAAVLRTVGATTDRVAELLRVAVASALRIPEPKPEAGWVAMLVDGDVVLAGSDIADEPLDAAWWGGPPAHLVRGEGDNVLERAVQVEALPRALRAWQGRRLRLLGARGQHCVAEVDGFAGRSMFVDHNLSEWGAEYVEEWGESVVDRTKQPAAEAWSEGQAMLLGTLSPVSGDCKGAIYATWYAHAAPTTFSPRPDARGDEAAALEAFRALPVWAEVQADHLEGLYEDEKPGGWDAYDGAEPVLSHFSDAAGARTFVVVSAYSGGECGGAGGELMAVFERADDGTLDVVLADRWSLELVGLADLDGDARPELIERGSDVLPSIFRKGDDGIERFRGVEVPDHTMYGCPC